MKAVLDASVAVKWFVSTEEGSPQAHALLIPGVEFYAPAFFRIELLNVLLRYTRRGVFSEAEFHEIRSDLDAMNVFDYIPDQELEQKAIEISIMLQHPLYDCYYLACAMDQDTPLISVDTRFIGKIQKCRANLAQYVLPLSEVQI